MAAVSAWGKPGAWALDAEENEAELLHQHKQDTNGGAVTDFPSLSAAASTKTKKKKPQTISLQEFRTLGSAKTTSYQPKGLTPDELLALPTAPRERSAEELDRSKLGGGFRSYGGGMRDDQPRRGRDSDRDFAPSRADGIDNWSADKKPSFGGGSERRERGGFFSRAEEVHNWASKKSFVPSVEPRRYEMRGGFGFESSNGGADSSDWGKGRRTGGAFDSLTERRGVFESNVVGLESWGKKTEEGSGNGSRPRLNLQPRTKHVSEEAVKPKGSSPFGDARPREEVLKEKGQDWKEIEEKLESAKIKDVNAWWKPESADSRAQSDAGSENGHVENIENGHAEEAEDGDAQM